MGKLETEFYVFDGDSPDMPDFGARPKSAWSQRTATARQPSNIEYNDERYGPFELPPIVQAIIDTKLFRRLKEVHQLGFLWVLNPEAKITRYQHCIGTYLAATQHLRALQENSTTVGRQIFERSDWPQHELAVQLAALLHDVGHGPISHLWEHIGDDYKHEVVGLECVNLILNELNLSQYTILKDHSQYVIDLIKALIVCRPENVPDFPEQFRFIFEIVNNKRLKVDVDKWDYLRRDYHFLTKKNGEIFNNDIDDVFLKCRISDDGAQILYRYADAQKFYTIFELRFHMWVHFYRNLQNRCRDNMFETMVQCSEIVPNINGIPATAIRPGHEEFLQLHDNWVLEFFQHDPWYQSLFSANELPRRSENSIGNGVVLQVKSTIKAPSKVMPPLKLISFYGCEGDMPNFDMIEEDTVLEDEFVLPARKY